MVLLKTEWDKVMKPAKSFTKSETCWNWTQKKGNSRQKFKKAIPVAEMFTSKTISMRLNLNFWIIFIGNSAVDCHALFSNNRSIITWFIFEEKLYFRHFSMISGWNGLFQSINRNFLPYQKARGKTVQRGINRSPPPRANFSIIKKSEVIHKCNEELPFRADVVNFFFTSDTPFFDRF